VSILPFVIAAQEIGFDLLYIYLFTCRLIAISNVDPACEFLCRLEMGNVSDVSEVDAASIFRMES
jgi:hypothetical protein